MVFFGKQKTDTLKHFLQKIEILITGIALSKNAFQTLSHLYFVPILKITYICQVCHNQSCHLFNLSYRGISASQGNSFLPIDFCQLIDGNSNSLSQIFAFVSDRGGRPQIYVMNADGSDVTRLSYQGGSAYDPVWSPDGTKLAFLRIQNETGRVPFIPRREALPWSIAVHDFANGLISL